MGLASQDDENSKYFQRLLKSKKLQTKTKYFNLLFIKAFNHNNIVSHHALRKLLKYLEHLNE